MLKVSRYYLLLMRGRKVVVTGQHSCGNNRVSCRRGLSQDTGLNYKHIAGKRQPVLQISTQILCRREDFPD